MNALDFVVQSQAWSFQYKSCLSSGHNVHLWWKRFLRWGNLLSTSRESWEYFSISIGTSPWLIFVQNWNRLKCLRAPFQSLLHPRKQQVRLKMSRQWRSLSYSPRKQNMNRLLDYLLLLWEKFCIWSWNNILKRWWWYKTCFRAILLKIVGGHSKKCYCAL